MSNGFSRRDFFARAAVPAASFFLQRTASAAANSELPGAPDLVIAHSESGPLALTASGGKFQAQGIAVELRPGAAAAGSEVHIEAPGAGLVRLQLRWRVATAAAARILGDEWERGYGEMEWRGLAADRILPWYFLLHSARATHGYGSRRARLRSPSGRWMRRAFPYGWTFATAVPRCNLASAVCMRQP